MSVTYTLDRRKLYSIIRGLIGDIRNFDRCPVSPANREFLLRRLRSAWLIRHHLPYAF
jgi:hypothetical protein